MTTDVVTQSTFSLTPTTLTEAMSLAKLMAESDLVPKDYRGKPGNVLIAVQMGHEVGLQPMAAVQTIAVINGRPSLFGDSGKAILLAAGCIIEEDDAAQVRKTGVGRCKITRPGRPPVERTFSKDDAKQARLLGKEGPWSQYPERMLAWRAFWFAARDAAADLLKGLAGAEEVRDIPPEKDMGDAQEVSKTDAVRAALAGDMTKVEAPKANLLNGVLFSIQRAETPEQMAEAATACLALGDDDKAIARKAYAARQKELKAASAPADGAITYAEIADKINKAQNVDQLAISRDLIRSIADEEQRQELMALANDREANEFANIE